MSPSVTSGGKGVVVPAPHHGTFGLSSLTLAHPSECVRLLGEAGGALWLPDVLLCPVL